MVQIAGKYQLSSRENFPPPPRGDKPPPGDRPAPSDITLEVKVEGGKYTFITSSSKFNRTTVLEDGKETEYKGHRDETIKATTKVSGNIIEVEEKISDGRLHKKKYTFTDDGFEETIPLPENQGEGKMIFKRI